MVIIQLAGGLGNQMFQYALYLQLKSRGREVKIDDVSGFAEDAQRAPALAPFGITYERPTKAELCRMLDSSPMPWHRVRRKLFGRHKKAYFEETKLFVPEVLTWDDIYLEGYWQSQKYFREVEDKVRAAYNTDRLAAYLQRENFWDGSFREDSSQHEKSRHENSQYGNSQHGNSQDGNSQHENSQYGNSQHENSQYGNSQHGNSQHENFRNDRDKDSDRNKDSDRDKGGDSERHGLAGQYLDMIDNTCSVSIHVRRGDYLTPENQALFGGICTDAYYIEGIRQMRERYPDCKFYLFSNDRDWQEEDRWGEKDITRIVLPERRKAAGHNRVADYAEFLLMSRCRHHILANSSFSWWASYLNPNPGKTVFVPDRWLNGTDCRDFYREDMLKIRSAGLSREAMTL